MRIAVFSDSHGRIHNCIRAMESIEPVDHIIHLGDTARDAEDLGIVFPDIPITYVCGNSDFCSMGAFEKMIELGGKKIFICHGHTQSVKHGLRELAHTARGTELALFGHTHEAYDGFEADVHLFNPGSISLPASGKPSFGIIIITDGTIETAHRTL